MARVRSPAYPALSLPAAVDMIMKVHAIQQSTPEPREVVIRHMGYSGVNGRALKSLSALIKYGFLEKCDDGLRVTSDAVSIIHPDPEHPEKRRQALLDASREPALFDEIFDRWDSRPSDESLKAFLIRKGFNLNSVDQVTRAFYDTFDLVSDLSDSYDSQEYEPDETDKEDEKMPQFENKDMKLPPPPAGALLRNVTKPIFDFETVAINTVIDNQDDLEELMSRLEQVKAMLPQKTEH